MANPWKDRVIAFNKKRNETDEKANDMQIIAEKIAKLPPGQLKKLLTDEELCDVLRKYGVDV